jgi:hypothetical protein
MSRIASIVSAVFLAAGLASCVPVVFENPVPSGSRVLNQFPPELQGMYFSPDKEDTLIILADSYINVEDACFLGEDCELRLYRDFWVLNQRSKIEDQPGYLAILGKADKSGKKLEVFVFDASEEKLPLFKEILTVKEVYNEDTTLNRIVINPTDEQFMQLIDREVYVPYGTYERINP